MLIRICIPWDPLRTRAWARLLHHLVNLLKGEALCLGDGEIGPYEGGGAETAPDEEDGGAEVAFVGVHHVRGDDGDDLEDGLVSE